MLKRSLSIIFLSCGALGSMVAHAADEQRYAIDLTATIPTESFQVIPVESGWINQTQEMAFDLGPVNYKISPSNFNIKTPLGVFKQL